MAATLALICLVAAFVVFLLAAFSQLFAGAFQRVNLIALGLALLTLALLLGVHL